MKYQIGLNKEIVSIYSDALEKASTLGIDLKKIYDDLIVRKEYGNKINYKQILSADSSSSMNGFTGIVKELDKIKMIMQLSNSKSLNELCEIDKEIAEQSLSLISLNFEHISKWINNEQGSK
jgi:hypothetical protein